MEKITKEEELQAENQKLKQIIENLKYKIGNLEVINTELEVNNSVLVRYINQNEDKNEEAPEEEVKEG